MEFLLGIIAVMGFVWGIFKWYAGPYILEPARRFTQDTLPNIEKVLDKYSNIFCNPGYANEDLLNEACGELRDAAAGLRSKYNTIRWKPLNRKLSRLPSSEEIESLLDLGLADSKPLTEERKKLIDELGRDIE